MPRKTKQAKNTKAKKGDVAKISLTWGSCLKFWLVGFVMFVLFGMLWVGFSFLAK